MSRVRILKWIISLLAIFFLYYEIFIHHDAISLIKQYRDTIVQIYPSLLIVVILMPVNWLIESYKWKRLLNSPGAMSSSKAFQGVLMGVTLGLFTPNGVGEFAGRVWVVKDAYREKAVSSSIAGSLAQLCITITVGGGFVVFSTSRLIATEWLITARVLAVVTVIVGFVAYYKMPQIAGRVLSKVSFFNRYEKFKESLLSFSRKALTEAYFLSLLRYLTFCTQLGILLFAIGDLELHHIVALFTLIPVYYYIQTIIPTVALSEIGVRGLILLFLFSNLMVESEVILVSFLIWVINLIIPGLIGLIFLARTKFVKQ